MYSHPDVLIKDLLNKMAKYEAENKQLRAQMDQNVYVDCDGVNICEQLETLLIESDNKFNDMNIRESYKHMINGISDIIGKRKSKKHSLTYLTIAKENLFNKIASVDEALKVTETLRKQNNKLTNDLIRMSNKIDDTNGYLMDTHDKIKDYKSNTEEIHRQAIIQNQLIKMLIDQFKSDQRLDSFVLHEDDDFKTVLGVQQSLPLLSDSKHDTICPACKITIPSEHDAQAHISSCDGNTSSCPFCFKFFPNNLQLDAHITVRHSDLI